MVWAIGIGAGGRVLWMYDSTAGRPATAAIHWPAGAPVDRVDDKPSLLMFVHPKCPCSDASLSELSILMAHIIGRVDARVFFFVPNGGNSEWLGGPLWERARSIPGVRSFADPGGIVARAFGTSTSGETLLFDARGALLFSGGITVSRGHMGDNIGRDTIAALIEGRGSKFHNFPIVVKVFGCSLTAE